MTATICGHDRDALRWALDVHARLDAGDAFVINTALVSSKRSRRDAYESTRDPAKLAAIIAELLRERGIPSDTEFPATSLSDDAPTWVCCATEHTIDIVRSDDIRELTMSQARAFALRLLDSPAATIADIGRMIAEVTT